MKPCSFPDCDRPLKSRGLCGAHYFQRHVAGIELRPIRQKNKGLQCSVEECMREARALGLCGAHYQQSLVAKTPRPIKEPTRGIKTGIDKLGYVVCYVWPDHPLYAYAHATPYSFRRGLEHRLLMSRSVGRKLLKTEQVHHKDGNRSNNSLSNLQLRHTYHGSGQKIICADCGSHNTMAVELD